MLTKNNRSTCDDFGVVLYFKDLAEPVKKIRAPLTQELLSLSAMAQRKIGLVMLNPTPDPELEEEKREAAQK